MRLLPVALIIFGLMLPVTGMVPVLAGLTAERFPESGDFARHLFMSINMIGALVAAPIAGLLSDTLGRRVWIIAAAFAINALSLMMIASDISYAAVLTWRFIEGCAHMTALSLLMTLGADHAQRNRLGTTMGAVGAAVSIGVATGAPLGGWLGANDAVTVPMAGAWLMLGLALVTPFVLREAHDRPLRKKPGELLRALAANRLLGVPYLFAFVDRLTVGFIVSTFSLYLATVMAFDAPRIGLVMAAFLVPFSLLTWPSGALCRYWDRLGMMIAGSVLYGVFLVALGFSSADHMVWVMAAGGIVAALMYAPTLVLTAELAGPGQRASTMAGFNIAGSIGFALGPLLAGGLVSLFRVLGLDPYLPVFLIIAAIEICTALAMLPLWFRRRRAVLSS